LIATAKRPIPGGDRRLISVVLGTDSDQMRTQESQKLLNWGFQNFDTVKIYSKGQAVATPAVWKGTQNQVKLGFTRDIYITVPRGAADKLKASLDRKDPLVAPITLHSKAGMLKVTADGKPIADLPVVALEQIDQAGLFGRAWDSVRLLFE
jgi:D-alanyl-D-alanine carboxypeptidase (penicillin-binding protein 5/6)